MSDSYFIVCMKCKDGVHLGKSVYTRYRSRKKVTYGFSQLGYTSQQGWDPTEEGCSELQHFLMLHRNHELRVLPDTVDIYAVNGGFPEKFPVDDETADPYFNRSMFFDRDPAEPDPKKELNSLPTELVKRLKGF